jgi:hypothetical protein
VCVCVYMRARVCVCVCVCSLSYPACSAHAPYSHLRPDWLYHIFPHYLINDTIFKKKKKNTGNVFWFYLQICFEIFLILSKIHLDIVINVHMFLCKVPVILVR